MEKGKHKKQEGARRSQKQQCRTLVPNLKLSNTEKKGFAIIMVIMHMPQQMAN